MMSPAWWVSKKLTGMRMSLANTSRRMFWATRRPTRIMPKLTRKLITLLPT